MSETPEPVQIFAERLKAYPGWQEFYGHWQDGALVEAWVAGRSTHPLDAPPLPPTGRWVPKEGEFFTRALLKMSNTNGVDATHMDFFSCRTPDNVLVWELGGGMRYPDSKVKWPPWNPIWRVQGE